MHYSNDAEKRVRKTDAYYAEHGGIHVAPLDDGHVASPFCWCQPAVKYEDPVDVRGRVYLHKEFLDAT